MTDNNTSNLSEVSVVLDEPDETIKTQETITDAFVEELAVEEITTNVNNAEKQLSQEPVEEKIVIERKQNTIQNYPTNSPVNLQSGEILSLPSDLDKKAADILRDLPNINVVDNPEARDWADTLQEGLSFNTMNEVFVPTLEDKESTFKQRVQVGDNLLIGGSPKLKKIENSSLKGEKAILRVISHLGMGTVFQTPLWHSGIWVSFKPPTESELLELNRLMISDKINFGRNTYGLAFSGTTVYTVDRVVEFALSHVYDITAKSEDITIDNLKNHISCQDISSLVWGFICTMYPKGFRYKRACINDPEKCTYVLEDTINVTKLQWTNESVLTDWQKTHMSTRQSKTKDIASITRYKEELTKTRKSKVNIEKNGDKVITIVIKTPNITEYIDAGHKWIGEIVSHVEKTAGSDISKNEKDVLITRHAQASSIRQYTHWIESIEFDTNVIEDKETIENTLNILSSDDDIRNGIIKAVVDFINNSTISLIGIPVFDCPSCGKPQEANLESLDSNFKNIIPLDMIQVFFALVTQRLENLTKR